MLVQNKDKLWDPKSVIEEHGEEETESDGLRSNVRETSNDYEFDRVEEFMNVIEEDLRDGPEMFERLVSDSKIPLYDGCAKFTRLSTVLKLYDGCVIFGSVLFGFLCFCFVLFVLFQGSCMKI